jgi:predicted O-methyltransferase YrrM
MSLLRLFRFSKSIRAIERRLDNVEMVMETLIERPQYESLSQNAFNDQSFRKEIFQELIAAFSFKSIIETGTFVGDTTGYMAETSGVPVYSVEANKHFYLLAKHRLANTESINIELADSRDFIEKLGKSNIAKELTFFYLDAHWDDDVPLRPEIELIAGYWKEFVVMIDDFQVPGDNGYGYDNYGRNAILSLDYIRDIIVKNRLTAFFPQMASNNETGAKRGCVILCPEGHIDETICSINSLRKF